MSTSLVLKWQCQVQTERSRYLNLCASLGTLPAHTPAHSNTCQGIYTANGPYTSEGQQKISKEMASLVPCTEIHVGKKKGTFVRMCMEKDITKREKVLWAVPALESCFLPGITNAVIRLRVC